MSNLAAKELLKEATDRRGDRVETFLKKYESKEAFELLTGASVYLKVTKDNVALLREAQGKFNDTKYIKLLDAMMFVPANAVGTTSKVSKTGTSYQLKHFKKTPEFGGGGAGDDTERNESATALYCATRWLKKTATKEIYTAENLRAALSHVDVSLSATEKMFPDMLPDHWQKSCAMSANTLYAEYPITQNKKYIFHRGSRWVKQVESKFRELNNQLGVDKFSQINKWTPADIWMVEKGFVWDLSKINTLMNFNSELLRLAKEGKVMGISLKLVTRNAHLSQVNFTREKSEFKFVGYNVDGGRGTAVNFFGNNNVQVEFSKDGDIMYRTFGTTDNAPGYSGEISVRGGSARHGKIGLGEISKIFRTLTMKSAPEYTDIRAELKGGAASRKEFFKEFFMYAKDLSKDSKLNAMKQDEFMKVAGAKPLLWIMSKYIGVYILYHLKLKNTSATKKDVLDKFTEQCYLTASSQTPLSAPFLKIS